HGSLTRWKFSFSVIELQLFIMQLGRAVASRDLLERSHYAIDAAIEGVSSPAERRPENSCAMSFGNPSVPPPNLFERQITPSALIASATRTKPVMLAPRT